MQRLPCTLAGLQVIEEYEPNQWNSHVPVQKEFICTEMHGNESCPMKIEEEQYSSL